MPGTLKLNSGGAGNLILTPSGSVGSDVTMTVPAATGTMIYANASGNVGIGTSSPSVKLDVTKSTGSAYVAYITSGVNVSGSDNGLFIGAYDENSGSKVLNIQTNTITPDGAGYKSRLVVQGDGAVLIGTTTAQSGTRMVLQHGNSGNGQALATVASTTSAVNAISFQNPNGQIGRVQVDNTTTSYITSSDYRLKENIAPMTGALAKVSALKPVTYTWKIDGSNGQGFIAHELQEVVPEAIAGNKDEVDENGNPVYQGIDTSFLVATLTAAIQEQQAIISDLKARIETLESK